MQFNWGVVLENWPVFLEGARMTLFLSALGVVFGTLVGMFVGMLRSQSYKNPVMRVISAIAAFYIEIMRGTPFIVQLYLVYYGLPLFFGVEVPELLAGIAAISLNSGAYVSEIFRAGIQSIDKGQMEAGRSLGLTWWQTMRTIILPQAVKRSLPPLGNEFITLIKESSIVSVIGIQELQFKGRIVSSSTYAPFESMFAVAIIYLLLTFVTGRLVGLLERRMKTGDQH
ncbi:MAG: glnP 3 [Symbiobacteriaceae bacterium]|jgi:His/Glu/Gln/Arg/opine family amino acid ABC transporter permease subunit|nr:glnP 3 [Symbiobacteriaceae bacterium]